MQNLQFKTNKVNSRKIQELFTPSWLSGLLAILAGLVVSVGVILIFSLDNGQASLQLASYEHTSSQPALTLPGQNVSGPGSNSLENTWPILAFWGMVGFFVYLLLEMILKMISNAEDFTKELNYVHTKRDALIRTTLEYVLARFISVVFWLIFINLFFKKIIPYTITASHASAGDFLSGSGILYAFLAFAVMALSLHLHAVFLRLSLGRPRAFSSVDY